MNNVDIINEICDNPVILARLCDGLRVVGEVHAAQKLESRTVRDWEYCLVNDATDMLQRLLSSPRAYSPSRLLNALFLWRLSPEGEEYWMHLHRRLEEEEEAFDLGTDEPEEDYYYE